MQDDKITPELMLRAYAQGIFPMAETADSDELFWVEPKVRGILPIDGFHVSRSLARHMRQHPPTPVLNRDFGATVQACCEREETWINAELFDLYMELHVAGFAHGFEVFEDGELAGGVFGIALQGLFCGESMFSKRRNGSKVALALLIPHLKNCGFQLFDTQFPSDHLQSLGGQEISQDAYLDRLSAALLVDANIHGVQL